MATPQLHALIVGKGHGGAQAALTLRRMDLDGPILMIEHDTGRVTPIHAVELA